MRPLFKIATKHARNSFFEQVALHTPINRTRPVFFYGLSTNQCNAKCLSCNSWREPRSDKEMTIDEWQRALLGIRDLVGSYSINFSGGEPLVKKGFIDLLHFCKENGIFCGMTTNAFGLSQAVAGRIVDARPFNVNISLDGPDPELHDYLRGTPGLFDRVADGVRNLLGQQADQGVTFPIIIKPTISAKNFRQAPEIVDWAQKAGATAVNFQPIDDWNWTEETRELLWVKPEEFGELEGIVDRLIKMKDGGAPIMNTKKALALTVRHFRGDKAPASSLPCRIGLSYFYIGHTGDVRICPQFPPIGNVRHQSATEIRHSDSYRSTLDRTLKCEQLCLLTCTSSKTIRDRIDMGKKLLKQLSRSD